MQATGFFLRFSNAYAIVADVYVEHIACIIIVDVYSQQVLQAAAGEQAVFYGVLHQWLYEQWRYLYVQVQVLLDVDLVLYGVLKPQLLQF